MIQNSLLPQNLSLGRKFLIAGRKNQKQSTHSGQSNKFNLNVITEKPVRELKVCKLTH